MELSWWKKFLFMLLPTSSIFSSVKDRFFTAMVQAWGTAAKSVHEINGQNLTDIFTQKTTRLEDHSDQFGYVETQDADRVSALWAEEGGQSPDYLQSQLHAAGLTNLYVHEWWVEGSDPPVARNPILYIRNHQPNNLLVNPVSSIYDDIPQCGDDLYCGDNIYCGDSEGLKYEEKIYPHPDVVEQYPFYFYVCGETFGVPASLTDSELIEAKRIIYKIKAMEQRCVLITDGDVWINTPYTGDELWINTPYTGDELYINIGDR